MHLLSQSESVDTPDGLPNATDQWFSEFGDEKLRAFDFEQEAREKERTIT